jgi:hypothetical protein
LAIAVIIHQPNKLVMVKKLHPQKNKIENNSSHKKKIETTITQGIKRRIHTKQKHTIQWALSIILF